MKEKVDMTYSFMSDEEPTEEQLQVIMEAVAEKASAKSKLIEKMVIENIEKEYRKTEEAINE
jgi:hypothetical protein